MIAVIADDFTGAAELAGIALRYGLKVGLYTKNIVDAGADVVVVSTDSRSLSKEEAMAITEKTVRQLMQLNPSFIYKKTDSVLRGYVVDELKVQMQLQGLNKALLLPANPSLGRTIVDGHYFVKDTMIHKTDFAADPEFAIHDSLVTSMLRTKDVAVIKHSDVLPDKGIVVGEVLVAEDIEQWIEKVDNEFLLAGAGDFFDKLLQVKFRKKPIVDEVVLQQPHLYVCGTSFNKSVAFVKTVDSSLVYYLSYELLQSEKDATWFMSIAACLAKQHKAIIALDDAIVQPLGFSALQLRTIMATVVQQVVLQNKVSEVLIEGGSTAAAILEEMHISSFMPTNELSRGVIRMKAVDKDLFITVKPGSYELSPIIKRLYTN